MPLVHRPVLHVNKSWGHEVWLANSPAYCAKLLYVDEGCRCSIHYHERKAETLYVLEGAVTMEYADEFPVPDPRRFRRSALRVGEAVEVQPYVAHRFAANLGTRAVILETSTQHFEHDSHRCFEDTQPNGRI